MSAWLRWPGRPASPPDPFSADGRRASGQTSSAASFDFSTARAVADVRHPVLHLQRGLLAVLVVGVLMLVGAMGAKAYTDDEYDDLVSYIEGIRDNPPNTAVKGNPVHVAKWNRVLAAIGADGQGKSAWPEATIHSNADQWPSSPWKRPSDYLKWKAQQQDQTESTASDYTDYQTVVNYLIGIRDNPPNAAVRGNLYHIRKWNQVLEAIGYDTGTSVTPMAEATIHANAATWPDSPFHAASTFLNWVEAQEQASQQGEQVDPPENLQVVQRQQAVTTITGTIYAISAFSLTNSYVEGAEIPLGLRMSERLPEGSEETFHITAGGSSTLDTDYTLACQTVAGTTCTRTGNTLTVVVDGDVYNHSRDVGTILNPLLKLNVLADNFNESGETLTLTVTTDAGVGRLFTKTLVEPSSMVTLQWARTTSQVYENNGPAEPVIRLSNPWHEDIPLTIRHSGSARHGIIRRSMTACTGDYEFPSETVIATGVTSYGITVEICHDDLHEPNKWFSMEVDTSKLPTGVSFGSNSPRARVEILEAYDNPFSPSKLPRNEAQKCVEKPLFPGELCGPGGHQVMISIDPDWQNAESFVEGNKIRYWLYPSPPPTSGNVTVKYKLRGYSGNNVGLAVLVPPEGRSFDVTLGDDGWMDTPGHQLVAWYVASGSNYQIEGGSRVDSFYMREDQDPIDWSYDPRTLNEKIQEGTERFGAINFDNRRKANIREDHRSVVTVDLGISGCALSSTPLAEDAAPVGAGAEIPCHVDFTSESRHNIRNKVVRTEADVFEIRGPLAFDEFQYKLSLYVGQDADKVDESITLAPDISYNLNAGAFNETTFPKTITVIDDDRFEHPDENGKDTIYIQASSAPATPTGGTSTEDHVPTDWSRDKLQPTSTDNVYRSQRDRTYSGDTFVSATAWGTPEKILDAVPQEITVSFTKDDYPISENNAPAAVVIQATGTPSRDYVIPYVITPVTATYPDDFFLAGDTIQPRTGTILLKAGLANQRESSEILIVNDDVYEGSETFTVTLQDLPPGVGEGTPIVTTVTILDDEVDPNPPNLLAAKILADTARNARCHPEDDPATTGIDESTIAPVDDPATPDIDESDCVANIEVSFKDGVEDGLVLRIPETTITTKTVDGAQVTNLDVEIDLLSDLDYSGDLTFSLQNLYGYRFIGTGVKDVTVTGVELKRAVSQTLTVSLEGIVTYNDHDGDGLPLPSAVHRDEPDGKVQMRLKSVANVLVPVYPSFTSLNIEILDEDATGVHLTISSKKGSFMDNRKEGPEPDIIVSLEETSGSLDPNQSRHLIEREWIEIPLKVSHESGPLGGTAIAPGKYELTPFKGQENVSLRKIDDGYIVRIEGRNLTQEQLDEGKRSSLCNREIDVMVCLNFVSRFKPDDPSWVYDTQLEKARIDMGVSSIPLFELQTEGTQSNLSGGWLVKTGKVTTALFHQVPSSDTTRSFILRAEETTIAEPDSGYAYLPFEMELFPEPSAFSGFAFCANVAQTTASYYHDYTIIKGDEYDMIQRYPNMEKYMSGYAWGNNGCSKPIWTKDRFQRFYLKVKTDSHDEGEEIIRLHISQRDPRPDGNIDASNEIRFTITNDGPIPAAFLARFGRTLAQQTLTGLTGRLTAPRTPGLQGTLAGQTFQVEPAEGRAATPTELLTQVLAGVAQSFGTQPGSFEPIGPLADDPRRGALQGSPRLLTPRQVLLGSRFTLTSQPDAGGGSFGFWGRAAQGYFDGAERGDGTALTLDGSVTTGFLGADYARGPWLLGVALTHSRATGTYAALGGPPPCPLPDQTVCDGAVRAGTGDTETTLTAAIPYAALEVAERLQLWGAGGYGAGDVTLKTMGARYEADTTWAMAAAGLRGALLPPTAGAAGPDLAVTSDAFWTRTASDRTRDLAASASQVTRLRLGLAGSWRMAVGTPPADARSGASLTPKLELGARQDGGDAETGLGVEIGGGVAWVEPAWGLSLDLAGRTLLAHENDDLRDRGFSAALAFDPTPATPRGPMLSLRQDVGSPATGGLDALFTAAPLADRTGQAAPSRWGLEAAYGFPVFGGHFTGSPHLGVGLAPRIRDYRLGWRLTPDAASALALSLDLAATRQERDAAAPVHTVGVEVLAQW
ncbi:MAG: hypothetical protein OXL95_00455 [Nitrospira sp.]|nr:hypothetical protein [Nitrospira sp.]